MITCKPFSKSEYIYSVSSLVKGKGLPKRDIIPETICDLHALKIPTIPPQISDQIEWIPLLSKIVLEARSKGIIDDLIVHGSYGDGTFNNFSDLDISIVLSNKMLLKQNGNHLCNFLSNKINPFLFFVDPLQHHGVFFLWKDIMKNYNELILPISAYKNSWSFSGLEFPIRKGILLNLKDQKKAYISTLNKLLQPNRYFFKYGMSPYAIKRLISNFLLLPAFYFQSQNKLISKDAAIKEMIKTGCKEIEIAFDSATTIRSEWPPSPIWLSRLRSLITVKKIPNGIVDYLFTGLYRNFELERKFKQYFLPQLHRASNALISKIQNENR